MKTKPLTSAERQARYIANRGRAMVSLPPDVKRRLDDYRGETPIATAVSQLLDLAESAERRLPVDVRLPGAVVLEGCRVRAVLDALNDQQHN